MTNPGSPWPGQGGYPPQQPYPPQPAYPQPPYPPQRPAPSGGIAIAATVLCTVESFLAVFGLFDFFRFFSDFHGIGLAEAVLMLLANVLMIVGTILLWCRIPAGRMLAIIALSLYVADIFYTVYLLATIPHFNYGPAAAMYNAIDIVTLVFVALPATGQYLKVKRAVPGYPQQPYPRQPYPQPPYPGQPAGPSGGTTITASILLTISCIVTGLIVFFAIRNVTDDGVILMSPLIQGIVTGLIGLLIIVATIMLWARVPVARMLAIIALAAMLAFSLFTVNWPHFHDPLFGANLGRLDIIVNLAALVLVAVPSTAAYLTARRTKPLPPVPPAYVPQPGRPR